MQRSTRFIIIGLVAIGFALYAFNFGNPLFWDDDDWIINNPVVHELSYQNTKFLFSHDILAGVNQSSNYYRPMLMLSFAFNWVTGGESPFGYHLVSNGLHIGSAVLIFLLLSALFRHSSFVIRHSKVVAGIAALWWLVHPLNTEAVTYISGRGDPLSVFFMLLALVFLIRSESLAFKGLPGSVSFWRGTALVSAVLAILSRETAVLFPGFVIIVFMSFVYAKERFWAALWRSLGVAWPFIAISGLYGALRLTALNFENTLNWHRFANVYSESVVIRTWTFFGALFDYVRLAFVPVGLHMERNVPVLPSPLLWPVPLVAFLLVLLLAQTYRSWQRGNRLWFFGTTWFFLALAPASGIIAPINSLIYEHWMYLPLIGLLTIASAYAVRLYEWAREKGRFLTVIVLALGISYLAFLAVQTVRRNILWGKTEVFFQHILSFEPENVRVLNNLANLYADQDDSARAEEYWRRAILADPSQPAPYHNLGNLARDREQFDEAGILYLKAIEISPGFHYAYRNLYGIYISQQRYNEAMDVLFALRELVPTDVGVHYSIANLFFRAGEIERAREALELGIPYLRVPEQIQAYEDLLKKL